MWPFKKKEAAKSADAGKVDLSKFGFEWTSGEAFFDLHCKFGDTKIEVRKGIIAIVLDAAKLFGTSVAVTIEVDGTQLAIVRVAGEDGGFVVPAKTVYPGGPALIPGDIVVWVPMGYVSLVAEQMGDKRSGWVGLITAKVSMTQPADLREPLRIAHYYDRK